MNYKYNININQRAAIESNMDLDIIDLAVFDFIKDFSNTRACVHMQTDIGDYFWVSHKKVIEQLPLLGIKSTRGVSKRIDNLIKNDVLKKHPDCDKLSRTMYKFSKGYDLLTFYEVRPPERNDTPPNESSTPPERKFQAPPNESSGYNNNNSIIKPNKSFKPPTLEEVKSYCLERGNNVDCDRFVDHYTAKGWMIGKNKMKDWKAAVRTWEKPKNDNQQPTLFANDNNVSEYSLHER